MRLALAAVLACAALAACSPKATEPKAAQNKPQPAAAASTRLPDTVAILPAAGVVPTLLDEEKPYWAPSHALVVEADAALPGYLRATAASQAVDSFAREGAAQILTNYAQYRRQYFGVTRNRRQILYVRGFCDVHDQPDWRTREVMMMDGGPCYFFARYDPATRRFVFFEPNGFA